MEFEKGSILIYIENIFFIIKKWLYFDKDIFIREFISNGCDVVSKYKRFVLLGEILENKLLDYKIIVFVNKGEGIFKFIDNGIGMIEEEIKKYIN